MSDDLSQNGDIQGERELDRLQIQWILGRNRSQDSSLSKEQIVRLLDGKRIVWGQLSEDEKSDLFENNEVEAESRGWKSIGSPQNKSTEVGQDEKSNDDLGKGEKIDQFIDTVVEGMRMRVEAYVDEDLEKVGGGQIDSVTRNRLINERFTYEYEIDIMMLKRFLRQQYRRIEND